MGFFMGLHKKHNGLPMDVLGMFYVYPRSRSEATLLLSLHCLSLSILICDKY